MIRRLLFSGCCLLLLILLLPACQGSGNGQLTVVFPTESTERSGGQSLRVTVTLTDQEGQPVEGATIQTKLYAPNGDLLVTLPCDHKGQGRYLTSYVPLPLRGAGGTWRVVAQATWDDGNQAHTERTFEGVTSISERYQEKYGFWLESPQFFEYSPLHPGEPHYEDWPYEDGGGYVIIENYRRSAGGMEASVSVDVHWQRADWPPDEATAIAHVQELAALYFQNPNTPCTNLTAESVTFQGRPAWQVAGQWEGTQVGRTPPQKGPVEWTIFYCPGSPHPQGAAPDWLWTLVISTNDAEYMDDLRALREKFECPRH